MKRGFTLVELSIVLVIIGLIIGGILAGQSMVSNSKVTAQVQQYGQLDAQVMAFKTRYNGYLPGDVPFLGSQQNGDGLITRGRCCWGNQVGVFTGETEAFFGQLDPQKYKEPTPSDGGSAPITTGPNKDVPLAKMGKPGSFLVVTAAPLVSNNPTVDTVNKRNYYIMVDKNSAQTPLSGFYVFDYTTSTNSAATPNELLALDKKIDDGVANSGIVISGRINLNSSGTDLDALTTCSVGANYIISNPGYECTPLVRVGGSTGDPQ